MSAIDITRAAVALRRTHPHASALDVLDLVMQGRQGQAIEFGDLALPPGAFGLLVVEAFDKGMPPGDWAGLMHEACDPRVRVMLLKLFVDEVWPLFVMRYTFES